VSYVSRTAAAAENLTYYDPASGAWHLKADSTGRVRDGERGRKSIRLESKERFRRGLFVIDAPHMPTGCGTWPAFWMYDSPWPDMGEIDIIEGVHDSAVNSAALHTGPGCSMDGVPEDSFQGQWNPGLTAQAATNCYVEAPGQSRNQGCSLGFPDGTFGAAWNEDGGGAYAALWDESGVQIWAFRGGCVPEDLRCGRPEPSRWGMPAARFSFGPRCGEGHFASLRVVINLTFCGDWAGVSWPWSGCLLRGVSCDAFVRGHPEAFAEAFWAVRAVQVYRPAPGVRN